mgnify:CR=1 FL=1
MGYQVMAEIRKTISLLMIVRKPRGLKKHRNEFFSIIFLTHLLQRELIHYRYDTSRFR